MNFSKIPVLRSVYNRYKSDINSLENKISVLSQENINLRFKIKKLNNEKIKVVFLCHRPAVWGSLKTVYEAMKSDEKFNVTIVTLPNKKQLPKLGFNHETYETEGAEEFWKGSDVISGYNYDKKEFIALNELKPDYVFIQQPYNILKPDLLKSSNISSFAKVCYVPYFTFLANKENNLVNEQCNPSDFLKDLSMYFTQSPENTNYIKSRISTIPSSRCKVIMSGNPCFDYLNKKIEYDDSNWNFPGDNSKFRIIWTPRWCLDEGNCNFFEYKDLLPNYCISSINIDFIFRPHPQAFSNWLITGMLSKKEIEEYKKLYEQARNIKINIQKDYIKTFNSSDCLVTDISSIIPEYFLTGKPIIYCHKKGSINSFIKNKGYTAGFYWVENWNELKTTLDMLRSGNDPLKEKRKELIKSEFYVPNDGAGYFIKEEIKNDFINS